MSKPTIPFDQLPLDCRIQICRLSGENIRGSERWRRTIAEYHQTAPGQAMREEFRKLSAFEAPAQDSGVEL